MQLVDVHSDHGHNDLLVDDLLLFGDLVVDNDPVCDGALVDLDLLDTDLIL